MQNMPPVACGEELHKMCSFIIYNLYTIFMGRIYAKIKKSVYLFVIKYDMFLALSAWYFIMVNTHNHVLFQESSTTV